MFTKLLLVTAVVSAVSAFRYPNYYPPARHYPSHNDHIHESLFEDVARGVKALDDKLRNSCGRYSNGNTREIVGSNFYKIATPLTGFSKADFLIKIKGRVIFIYGYNDGVHYAEVRTLPTFVDISKAYYSYYEDHLGVVFPINSDASTCDLKFSDIVRTVPYVIPGSVIDNHFD